MPLILGHKKGFTVSTISECWGENGNVVLGCCCSYAFHSFLAQVFSKLVKKFCGGVGIAFLELHQTIGHERFHLAVVCFFTENIVVPVHISFQELLIVHLVRALPV